MNDEKLFELAINLVSADVQSAQIPPAMMNREQLIEDRLVQYHKMLRRVWREQARGDNVEPMNQ